MFGFFKKRADVLNHWIAFVDQFSLSPSEFYASLEKELHQRNIPKMEFSRIEFPEGGLLSEKRVYLRMLRERIVFDVCAAPFGNGFFFSCRTAEIPLVLKLWQLIAVLSLLVFGLWALVELLDFFWGMFVAITLFVAGIYLLRNLGAFGLQDIDMMLCRSPLLGSVYEVFFRKETYHRIDSRLCYVHLIPTIVKKLADDATAEKGFKLIDQFELSPILGELYKPTRPAVPPASSLPLPESRLSM